MLHDVNKRRAFYVRSIRAQVQSFDGAELSGEYQPFLEVLTAVVCLLEAGRLWELHPTTVMLIKRCPLVHRETKRRRKALWQAVTVIQKEVATQGQGRDPELKELKNVLALVNKALCGLPERLTLGSDRSRVTVTSFFQEQMLLATKEILVETKAA